MMYPTDTVQNDLQDRRVGFWRDVFLSSRRLALAALGIALLQAILYGPSLIGRKVLLPLDVLAQPGVYIPQTAETQKTAVHNHVLSDLVYIGEPCRRWLASELRTGCWPSWNPYQFAGAPTLAPRFSPFVLLSICCTSPVIIAWVQLLIAEVAGIGFYLFCRKTLGTAFWPAAVTAWCYPLTGYFVFWQGYGLPMTVCWLPWLLLAVDAVVRGGHRWAWPGMALFSGLVVVSGQTDVAGQVLLTAGLFALWRLVEAHGRRIFTGRGLRTVVALAGGWGIGFLLAAPHLLPMLEYTRTGARMQRRGKGEEERPPVGLAALPQIVVPHFYGSTEEGFYPAFPPHQGNLLESSATAYAGLLATLLLAPLAFCSRRHRSLNLFWVLLSFVALSWQLNIPGMVQLLRSPLLNMMSHNRFVFAAAFAILAMAAVGLDLLARGQWSGRWWFGIPVALLAVLALIAAFRAIVPPEPVRSQLALAVSQGRPYENVPSIEAVREIQGNFLRTYLVTVGLCVLGLAGWLSAWRNPRLPRWFPVVAGALMVAELLWYGYGRAAQCDWSLYYPEIPVLKQVARAAEADHGRVIGAGRLVTAPVEPDRRAGMVVVRAYPDPVLASIPGCMSASIQLIGRVCCCQGIPALPSVLGCLPAAGQAVVPINCDERDPLSALVPDCLPTALRVVVRASCGKGDPALALVPGCLPAALAQTQGLSDVRGYDAVDPARFVKLLLRAADAHSPLIPYALTQMMIPAFFQQPDGNLRLHPVLDMLGVRYLIFRGTPVARVQADFVGDDYWVYVNRGAMPRVFVPRKVETIADESRRLSQLANLSFNARNVAYVESELAAALPAECRGSADITRETPVEIIVAATMETAGMLVLTDRWDRGWKASIYGKPAPIWQVNCALRGVELPAGKSEIIFRYEPASMAWGLRLGGLTLLIIVGAAAWGLKFGPLEGQALPEPSSPLPTDEASTPALEKKCSEPTAVENSEPDEST